jgi:hypothetical protein
MCAASLLPGGGAPEADYGHMPVPGQQSKLILKQTHNKQNKHNQNQFKTTE